MKLLAMPDEIKEAILTKYLIKSKTEFTVCFIEHRLDLNPSNFQPIIYKYLDELKRQIRSSEKELFSLAKANDVLFEWISPSQEREKTMGNNADLLSTTEGSPRKEMF